MHIRKVTIRNIRSITEFTMDLGEADDLAGWHILIGDNGSGKSSILKSISLGLIGPRQALRLNPNWEDWLQRGCDAGTIALALRYTNGLDLYSGKSGPYGSDIELELNLTRLTDAGSGQRVDLREFDTYPTKTITTKGIRKEERKKVLERANNYVWGENKGWFSVAYGPFRRFSGSDTQTQSLLFNRERVSAHASVFYESIALSNYRDWLTNLDYTSSRGPKRDADEAKRLYEKVKAFINQDGFLPYGTHLDRLEPTSTGTNVIFIDGNGKQIEIEQLGDGFRSVLSMTFELIRQMTLQYERIDQIFSEEDSTRIDAEGVVLIDEIDAHLHPEWQRTIGRWFTEHFPNIQFIVTTHSPLVCQAAIKGSIWRLPSPGSDKRGYQITPDTEEWKRLVYGNILEAYSTDLFGENIDRSPEAQAKMERVAELSAKEMDEPLTSDEAKDLERLLDELPATPYKRVTEVES